MTMREIYKYFKYGSDREGNISNTVVTVREIYIFQVRYSDHENCFSCTLFVSTTLRTSNTTSHGINYHHYRLYTKWLLQHVTSLIQFVCTKHGHYI